MSTTSPTKNEKRDFMLKTLTPRSGPISLTFFCFKKMIFYKVHGLRFLILLLITKIIKKQRLVKIEHIKNRVQWFRYKTLKIEVHRSDLKM